MLTSQLTKQIDELQAQINLAITSGDKDGAAALAEKLVQIARQEEARVYVINLIPAPIGTQSFDRSYGRVTVYGVGDRNNSRFREGEKYAVTEIETRSEIMDVLKGFKTVQYPARFTGDPIAQQVNVVNGLRVTHPPLVIARDVVQVINGDLPFATQASTLFGAVATGGVFLSDNPTPTPKELAEETAKLEKYYRAIVSIANMEWKKKPDPNNIWDCQRRAAEYLGTSVEWHELPEKMVECRGCGARVSSGIAVHVACGAVLNRKQALELEMIHEEPKKPRRQQEA